MPTGSPRAFSFPFCTAMFVPVGWLTSETTTPLQAVFPLDTLNDAFSAFAVFAAAFFPCERAPLPLNIVAVRVKVKIAPLCRIVHVPPVGLASGAAVTFQFTSYKAEYAFDSVVTFPREPFE